MIFLRWVLLVHGDSDGVCSGALMYAYLVSRGVKPEVYFTHPVDLAKDLKIFTRNGDNIFIADIALSETHLKEIMEIVGERGREGRVVYIDHHPEPLELKPVELPVEVVHDTCCSASELTYRFLEEEGFDSDYSRVALYGAIGDYIDDTVWVRKALDHWDKRSVYYEAGVLIQGLEGSRKEYDFKRRVVELLARNELPSNDPELLLRAVIQSRRDEELRRWVRENVKTYGEIAYVSNPHGSLGRAANYARVYGGKKIGLAYEESGGKMVMSLRASEGVDLNKMLRMITREIGGSGGGHSRAAGARIRSDKLEDFLELLNKYLATIK
jgi:single-stranded-DNA-specific exonuclease